MSFCDLKNFLAYNPLLNHEMFIPQKVLLRKLINEYQTTLALKVCILNNPLHVHTTQNFFYHGNIFFVFELVIMVVLKCFFFPYRAHRLSGTQQYN